MILTINNWRKWQGPLAKRPLWSKTYNSLLDSPDFCLLSSEDRGLLLQLWIAKSRDDQMEWDRLKGGKYHAMPDDSDFTDEIDLDRAEFHLRIKFPRDAIMRLASKGWISYDEEGAESVPENPAQAEIPGVTTERTTADVEEAFKDVWQLAPRKEGRSGALASFRAFVRSHRHMGLDVCVEYFKVGIRNYRNAPRFAGQEWKNGKTLFGNISKGDYERPIEVEAAQLTDEESERIIGRRQTPLEKSEDQALLDENPRLWVWRTYRTAVNNFIARYGRPAPNAHPDETWLAKWSGLVRHIHGTPERQWQVWCEIAAEFAESEEDAA